MSESCDITKLAQLLNLKKDATDSDDEIDNSSLRALGPADINKYQPIVTNDEDSDDQDEKNRRKNYEVCDPDDEASFQIDNENNEHSDWKKCPEWNVSYRQQVTPSDVFLQMGGKTPSTASCEEMIVEVHLPEEKRQNIDLKITAERLNLISPKFRLNVPLPHPVDPQRGNAQWNNDAEKLVITLRMNREFDYINF